MMDTIIKENHLSKTEHQKLEEMLYDQWFPWCLIPAQVVPKEEQEKETRNYSTPALDDWHLTHHASDAQTGQTTYLDDFDHLVSSVNQHGQPTVFRVKINLLPYCGTATESGFHVDMEEIEGLKTSIYYVNSSNGYTELEDGTKVDCVANRLVTFDGRMKHNAVRQTDTKQRIVVNICWT